MIEEIQLTPDEERQVTTRVELIIRHKRFTEWLNLGKREIATGRNVGHIKANLPQPHSFDEYETKRAIEEGLY
jgi:hypothetical protein